MTTRRYTNRPFPAYAYIPGQFPHPVRESNGHSFGQPEPHVNSFDIAQWQLCPVYTFGVDLFNAGFFWEAHEQWEALWHSAGRKGPIADFLKCLIKLAAAGVKHGEGKPVGVKRHLTRARALLADVRGQYDVLGGFCLDELDKRIGRVQQADSFQMQLQPE